MKINIKNLIAASLIVVFIHPLSVAATEIPETVTDSLTLQPVVVTGSRPSVSVNNLPMSVSVISGAQIEARMEQSVLPLLVEQIPGLFITSRGIMGYGVSTGSAGTMTMRGVGGLLPPSF